MQWGFMPTDAVRGPHEEKDVVYVSQCEFSKATANQNAFNLPTFYRQKTTKGDELDPDRHFWRSLRMEDIPRHRPVCFYGYSEVKELPGIRLPDETAPHIRYNNLWYQQESSDAGNEFIVAPMTPTAESTAESTKEFVTKRRKLDADHAVNNIQKHRPRMRKYSPLTDDVFFHPEELTRNVDNRREMYQHLRKGAIPGDLMTVTLDEEPGYVDVAFIPPLAPAADVTLLGGTIQYYGTDGNKYRQQSVLGTEGGIIPTDPDRFGTAAPIPEKLTIFSELPGREVECPGWDLIDEGIEDSDSELADSSPVIQLC